MYTKSDIVLGNEGSGKYFVKEVSHSVQRFYGLGGYGKWLDTEETSPLRIPKGSFGELLFAESALRFLFGEICMAVYYSDNNSARRRLHVVLAESKQNFAVNANQSFTSKIGDGIEELYKEISTAFEKASKLKHPALMAVDILSEELDDLD